ncbi:hypothetical histidine triad (HIT) protein [Rhodococcus erythropolis]|jgi:histidine triad (HIT) family protein|nr:hypothetical histidine triad (HIT) protein [Rhodococcus erythropolis]
MLLRLNSVAMSDHCLFCGIVAGTVPSVKVAEDETTYAFMDINPGSDGHILVIPKQHSKDLFEIPAEDLTDVTLAAQRIAKAAVAEFGADGVNLLNCCGADAWQTVFHFHLHVIPRYVDKAKDRLVLPWQPGTPGDMEAIATLGSRLFTAPDGQLSTVLD